MKQGWEIKTLGEVCDSALGKTLDRGKAKGEYVPYLCSLNVLQGCFNLSIVKEFQLEEKERERYLVRKGDLLVCEGGNVGRCAIWESNQEIYYQNALHRIRVHEDILAKYLMLYLNFLKENGTLDNISVGATIKHLIQKILLSIKIPLPPLSEQQRIVEVLDREFERIDTIRRNAETSLKYAKDLMQAKLKEELQQKEGWERKKLGEVCKTSSGGTPLKSVKEYYDCGKIPWLQSGEVCRKYITKSEKYITELGMQNSSAKLFPVDTVLIAMYGATAGQVGILKIESTTNQAVCGIYPNKTVLPEYLYYVYLNVKEELLKNVAGVAQPNLSQQTIKAFEIPFPHLTEQHQIVSRLDKYIETCRRIEENNKEIIAHCDALKQALLRKAFEGEL